MLTLAFNCYGDSSDHATLAATPYGQWVPADRLCSVCPAAVAATEENHATDLLKPAVCQTFNVCWWDLAIAAGLARQVTDMNVQVLITLEHGAACL